MNSVNNYEFVIDIQSIKFNHHHLFSVEHVLCQHLQDLYKRYTLRMQHHVTQLQKQKLQALRAALANTR